MKHNVTTSILPLTVSCIIFGFFTTNTIQQTINRIVTSYCYMITIVFVLVPLGFLLDKTTQMQLNMATVLYTVMHVARVSAVTYYRIKYITDRNVVSDIARNIAYADRSLERDAGVNVTQQK